MTGYHSSIERYPVSVDSLVFGYTEGELKIALIQRKNSPFAGMWALPGGFMEGNETVEEAAGRELQEETGIDQLYLEQFGSFNQPGRDPRGPTLTIALFALIRSENCQLIPTEDAVRAQWWPAYQLPPLAFDHALIYAKGLEALRVAMRTRPLAFELLPKMFTLTQLQHVYEKIFDIELDKRNFRKKLAKMAFVKKTDEKTEGGRQRPAFLHVFDPVEYAAFTKENILGPI